MVKTIDNRGKCFSCDKRRIIKYIDGLCKQCHQTMMTESERIMSIKEKPMADKIFVFGSNEAGVHGAGAALHAREHCGAIIGRGVGMQGTSYAIPTKDMTIRTLPLDRIKPYVDQFLKFARQNPKMVFQVTRIGCGLAGHSDADIAPMFKGAPDNCELPPGWRDY